MYLTLPTNIVFEKVPSSRLSTPLSRSLPPNDPATEQFVLDEIVKLVEGAGRDIVVLVDACTIRHHVRQELKELLDKTGFPVYSTPMGKTAISETHENYGGVSHHSSLISIQSLIFTITVDLYRKYHPPSRQGKSGIGEAHPVYRSIEKRL